MATGNYFYIVSDYYKKCFSFFKGIYIEFHNNSTIYLGMTFLFRLQRLAKGFVKLSFWWYGGDSRLLGQRSADGILVTANISESEH